MDTNAVIDFFNGKLPVNGRNFIAGIEPTISVITHIELLSGQNIPKGELALLTAFAEIAIRLFIDDDVVQQTISLRKQHRLKTPDAIIAATAIVHDLALITRNTQDFKNISLLRLLNAHEI